MSEYQYYEFQAIDRPLTAAQAETLRSYSTRARISPTSFVNDYSWGSFKGNEDAWMEDYFDAFLYLANWGTHILKLRLPAQLLDLKTARQYCRGKNARAWEKNGNVIVSFKSEDEPIEDFTDGEGLLWPLIPLRAELARGDLRSLYLGWLLCAREGEFDDSEVEPPVPAGLDQLSGSLASLVEFLRVDRDLLAVAAQTSAAIDDLQPSRDQIRIWLANLTIQEKDDVLADLIADEDRTGALKLRRRFREHLEEERPSPDTPVARRTVGELLDSADTLVKERLERQARQRAEEKERRRREAAIARARHLEDVSRRQAQLWREVDNLIATTKPKSYEQAIGLLVDLRDLAQRDAGVDQFRTRIETIAARHARKPAFVERLRKAGLLDLPRPTRSAPGQGGLWESGLVS